MHSTRKVKDDLIYVGGSDRRLSRFENLFPIPKGYPITAMCCWMRKPCCLTRRTSPSAVSISKTSFTR